MDKTELQRPTEQNTIVLEEQFTVIPSTDPSRINISEEQSVTTDQFNTLENLLTREVTITGVSLRWNGSEKILDSLTTTRDVTRIVIIADEVRIEQLLQWKGASVEIYARKLIFGKEGRIVTTPENYATEARTEKRDDGERPLDENGKIKAKDGRPGEKGGNISLFVGELLGGSDGELHLDANGAPGEMGEKGGLLPFKQRDGGPDMKNMDPIEFSAIEAVFADSANSTKQLNDIQHWQTSGGIGAEGLNALWAKFTNDSQISKGEFIEFDGHVVTDVRIGLGFRKFMDIVYHEVRVPLRTSGNLREAPIPKWKVTELWQATAKLENPWIPYDGENAFPSGTTGCGGAGGKITVSTPGSLSAGSFSNNGGASELSPDVAGGEAGTPNKYIYGAFAAMQFAPTVHNPDNSYVNLMDHIPAPARNLGTTKPGESAKGSAKGVGAPGGAIIAADALEWLEPRLMRIMADYARELYSAGHREQAWDVLAPYWHATRNRDMAKAGPDARSSLRAIENLVQNYQLNLDVYGNPPGWVPRFSASSYLRTYIEDRKFSYRFVGVMTNAIQLMNSLEHANAMLQDLSTRTESVIDQIHKELAGAYKRYYAARATLEDVDQKHRKAKQALEALEKEAEVQAILQEHDKAIVTAIFDVSAAVLSAIPVYQPALAGIGAVVKGVGGVVTDIVHGEDDGRPKTWKAFETISTSVATVLEKNASTFKSQLTTLQNKELEGKFGKESDDLETQIKQMRTSVNAAQDLRDEAILDAHNAVMKDKALAQLLSTDGDITETLAKHAENRETLMDQLKEHNRMLADLGDGSSDGTLPSALAQKRRQRLLIGRAKLYTLLANAQDEIRTLTARKESTAAIEARRKDFEEKNAALEKLLLQSEKQGVEKKMDSAKETFGQVLSGVERFANGAAEVGRAIDAAIQKPDPESEAVVALKARILANEKHGQTYADAQALVNEATEMMRQALLDLASCNQSVLVLTADLAGALQASIDIGHNRQAFALGIDPTLKASLGTMQRQAQHRMDYYLYLFRKAYMYERCVSAGDDVANLNKFIENIDTWLRKSRAALDQQNRNSPDASSPSDEALRHINASRNIAELSRMADTELRDLGNDAMRNTLSELAKKLLDQRHAQGVSVKNAMPLEVKEAQMATLARHKRVDLGPALDLIANSNERAAFLYDYPKLRITSIDIKKGAFVFRNNGDKPKQSIRLVIEVGREFILWDGSQYVMFRIGKAETPLSFGFSASKFEWVKKDDKEGWTGEFVADVRGGPNDPLDDLFATVMAEATGRTIRYTEMNPSFLSTLSVAITMGRDHIQEIVEFGLSVGWQAN